jgi:hypothetical protein
MHACPEVCAAMHAGPGDGQPDWLQHACFARKAHNAGGPAFNDTMKGAGYCRQSSKYCLRRAGYCRIPDPAIAGTGGHGFSRTEYHQMYDAQCGSMRRARGVLSRNMTYRDLLE